MMIIDYDILSNDYDLTRSVNSDTIKRILSKANIDENSYILDFGCGTGNYACAVKKLTDSHVYGVEPSDGMRQKARQKGYSMLHLISDEDFNNGLKLLKEDYKNKAEIKSNHGETLIWLKKENNQ